MTDDKQNELGLSNRERALYEHFESHPEELEKLVKSMRPVTEAIVDFTVKLSEAIKHISDAIIPIIAAMPVEDLINDEEDSEDD